MTKRKADSLDQSVTEAGGKKLKHNDGKDAPSAKPTKMRIDDSDSESDSETGGAKLANGFKVNEEYAKRFEHNKKREELQRCRFLAQFFYITFSDQISSGREICEGSQAC